MNPALYKDANNVWQIKNGISESLKSYSAGTCQITTGFGNNVKVEFANTGESVFKHDIMFDVTTIEKSATPDDFYASVADFKTATADFFLKAVPSGGNIDDGTTEGQLSFWNATDNKWEATARGTFDKATNKFKFGDIAGENFSEFESDGTLVKQGDATTWDDLRVSPNNAPNLGVNLPIPTIVSNDGTARSGTAGEFNGSSSKGVVPYYAALNVTDLSIALWVKADSVQSREILDRNMQDGYELYIDNGRLYFSLTGVGRVSTDANSIIAGSTHFIVVSARKEGANTRIKIYIDGISQEEQVVNELIATGTGGGLIVGEWHNGGWNFDGIIDDIQLYNKILTDAQITEIYNSGEGITGLPTGIVEATDLVARFQNSNVNAATLGSGSDMTLTNITLVTGLIGNTTGSVGVMLEAYPAGVTTSKFYTMQMPHGKKLRNLPAGTIGAIFNHFHWYPENNDAGDIVLGVELFWNQAGVPIPLTKIYRRVIANQTTAYTQVEADDAFPGTTPEEIAYKNYLVGKPKQRVNNVPSTADGGAIPPMDIEYVSSTIGARLFRDGSNALDTYAGRIFLHEFDAHIEYDTDGSRLAASK